MRSEVTAFGNWWAQNRDSYPIYQANSIFTSKLNSESSDAEARPARANHQLRNAHKTAPENQMSTSKRQNRKAESLKDWQLHNPC